MGARLDYLAMATAAQLRNIALSFPETEEKSHFEQPDFRVRGKIFAGLSRDETEGTLKLTKEAQDVVVAAKPAAFYAAAGAWGRSGWTRVRLAGVDVAELRSLVEEAFRLIAPKRLVALTSPPAGRTGRARGAGSPRRKGNP